MKPADILIELFAYIRRTNVGTGVGLGLKQPELPAAFRLVPMAHSRGNEPKSGWEFRLGLKLTSTGGKKRGGVGSCCISKLHFVIVFP